MLYDYTQRAYALKRQCVGVENADPSNKPCWQVIRRRIRWADVERCLELWSSDRHSHWLSVIKFRSLMLWRLNFFILTITSARLSLTFVKIWVLLQLRFDLDLVCLLKSQSSTSFTAFSLLLNQNFADLLLFFAYCASFMSDIFFLQQPRLDLGLIQAAKVVKLNFAFREFWYDWLLLKTEAWWKQRY